MISNIKKVLVKFNNRTVGYLAEIEDGSFAFQYADDWIKTGFSISPLSLPLSNKVFICKNRLFDGLYGVLNDSLPDGFGELLFNKMLEKNKVNPKTLSPLTKLCLINDNGLGGLNYEPNYELISDEIKPDLDYFSIEVNKILNNEKNQNFDEIYNLSGSSGGARPKAHIKENGEEWIVKFPSRLDPRDIGLIEYKSNELALKSGIRVNEFTLFPSKIYKGFFGAKRFDRSCNGKIHTISLAAILETTHRIPNLDYSHLFQVVNNICSDKNELYEVFRRMCFNVYYPNKDDHSKNFAFIYNEDKGSYELSPFYDITKTIDKFEHEMTVNGNGNPTDEDILALAQRFKLSIPKCLEIMNNIKIIISNKK